MVAMTATPLITGWHYYDASLRVTTSSHEASLTWRPRLTLSVKVSRKRFCTWCLTRPVSNTLPALVNACAHCFTTHFLPRSRLCHLRGAGAGWRRACAVVPSPACRHPRLARTWCQDAVVYVARFEHVIKIGTSTRTRHVQRILEQGMDEAYILAGDPPLTLHEAQFLEKLFITEFRCVNAIPFRRKVDLLLHAMTTDDPDSTMTRRRAHQRLKDIVTAIIDAETPLVRRHSLHVSHHLVPTYPMASAAAEFSRVVHEHAETVRVLTAFRHLQATILAMRGPMLVGLQQKDEDRLFLLIYNLRDLVGRRILHYAHVSPQQSPPEVAEGGTAGRNDVAEPCRERGNDDDQ